MKAEWLTLAEMTAAIETGVFRDMHGNNAYFQHGLAKQIAERIAAASKAKAERLKDAPGT